MSPNLIFLALFQSFFKRIQKGQIYSYHLYVYLTPLKYICKANLRLFSVTYQKVLHGILTFINPVNSIDDNQVHKNIDLNPPFMSTNPLLSVRNHQFRTLILHVFAKKPWTFQVGKYAWISATFTRTDRSVFSEIVSVTDSISREKFVLVSLSIYFHILDPD